MSGTTHEFDAGMMGCADGLSQEWKRQLSDVPVGDVLVTTAHDPVARDDLPALARLLGHEVISVELDGTGAIVVTVRRAK
jgi:TusA-related sulfurtransferase